MGTEQDTFDGLRRITYDEMLAKVKAVPHDYAGWVRDARLLMKENGWNIDDYRNEFERRNG